jgi:drug/metabolite transporter (DMT)-like permease
MIAISLGVLAGLCWGVHDLTAKRFADETGPLRMAFWVMALGFVVMLPIVLWRGTLWQAGVDGLTIAAIMGLFYAGAIGSLFKAFSLAPVSVVGPFTAGYPALVIFWNIANGLAPSALEWLALAFAASGALVVARTGPKDGGLNVVAPAKLPAVLAASLMASLCFASTIVLGQWGAVAIGQFETTLVSRLPGALVLLPFALQEQKIKAAISPFAWGGVLLMAVLDVAAVSAVNAAGLFPGVEYSAMGISLYGGIAVLLAMLFLKEKVSRGQWLGIAMVVAGVALLAWPK